jgi:capsule polysaccharide export protein KpsE/RkpR
MGNKDNNDNSSNVEKLNKVEDMVDKVRNQAREEFIKSIKNKLKEADADVRKCKSALINAQMKFQDVVAEKQQELELFDKASN